MLTILENKISVYVRYMYCNFFVERTDCLYYINILPAQFGNFEILRFVLYFNFYSLRLFLHFAMNYFVSASYIKRFLGFFSDDVTLYEAKKLELEAQGKKIL